MSPIIGSFSSGSAFGRRGGPAAGSLLYAFTTATFTSGGQTGRTGPALSTARAGLTGSGTEVWKNNTQFFNTSSGIQLWTVPADGTYRIETWGAQGGSDENSVLGGLGARMRGDFALTVGASISILIGQRGWNAIVPGQCHHRSGAGGGGSFVWITSNNTNPLIAAGGGGAGQYCNNSPINGQSTIGNGSGGSDATGGAGWNSNGGNTGNGSHISAVAIRNGGTGGQSIGDTCGGSNTKLGGFGGGNANGQYNTPCAGGGGYQGGNEGQGGLSFNAGTNQSNTGGVRSGNGQVQITLL